MASPLVCPRPKYRARTALPPRNTAVSSVNVTRAAAMPGGALDCVRLTMLVRALAVEMISAVRQIPAYRRNDFGGRQEFGVAAAVVGMIVRAEHVLHGQRGHALDLGHDTVVVLLV